MAQVPTDSGALTKVIKGINPTDDTGTAINGTGVDRMVSGSSEGYLSCTLQAAVGTVSGGTLTTFDAKLQDSSDDGGSDPYADITGAAITQITAADTEGQVDVNLKGAKRYVRAVVTTAVSAGSVPVAATLVFGGAANPPAS